jgi:tRNA-dihydrouridine synthase B
MVTAETSLYASRKTQHRLDHRGETGPISVQIVGNDPRKMAEAARANAARGAQIIDINMGCPKKKVCKAAAGSALMRDESLVGRILEAVVAAVEIPVTLKTRTGWAPDSRNALHIAHIAEQSGIRALAIHGRTRACGFSGDAEYDTIREVKAAVGIPVIANGDIDSPAKARRVLDATGADALMIGRAAQGRPWIFTEINHYLATGTEPAPPSAAWIKDLLLEHLENLYSFYGSEHGVRIARKHIAWYSRSLAGGSEFRRRVNRAQTTQEQNWLINDYFGSLSPRKEWAA